MKNKIVFNFGLCVGTEREMFAAELIFLAQGMSECNNGGLVDPVLNTDSQSLVQSESYKRLTRNVVCWVPTSPGISRSEKNPGVGISNKLIVDASSVLSLHHL